MKKILLFENNESLAQSLELNLKLNGYDVYTCVSPSEVPEDKETWEKVDLVILDLMMGYDELSPELRRKTENGKLTGLISYRECCKKPNLPVLVITALMDDVLLQKARNILERELKSKDVQVVKKPVEVEILLVKIEGML